MRNDGEDAAEQDPEGEVREEQRRVGHAPPACLRLRARVRILAGSIGDVARQDDLLHPGLPLDEDHRVGDLKPPRVKLELSEEVHDVHAPQLRADRRRVKAVRSLDRIR